MITVNYNSTNGALKDSEFERHCLHMTATTARHACVFGVHFFKHTPSVFSFGLCHRKKDSPGYVMNRAREMVIFDHPANVQLFDRDFIKTVHQIGRNFVVKIFAGACYFEVLPGNLFARLNALLGPTFFLREFALCLDQVKLRIAHTARIFDNFTVAQSREILNARIDANLLSSFRDRLWAFQFANQQCIPAINPACDSNLLDAALDWTGKPHTTGADTGNAQLVAVERAASLLLDLLRKGVIAVLALKAREACFSVSLFDALKECLECLIYPFKRIALNGSQMGFDFRQCACICQMARLFDPAKRFPCDLVAGDSFSKRRVVDLTRVLQFNLTSFDKLFVRSNLVLESFNCGIFWFSHVRPMSFSSCHLVRLERLFQQPLKLSSVYHTSKLITQQFGRERAAPARSNAALDRSHAFTAEGVGSFTAPRWQVRFEDAEMIKNNDSFQIGSGAVYLDGKELGSVKSVKMAFLPGIIHKATFKDAEGQEIVVNDLVRFTEIFPVEIEAGEVEGNE